MARAENAARNASLELGTLRAGPYGLPRYLRRGPPGGRLVVYLEGDAPAWRDGGSQLRQSPPPLAPLALELAAQDPAPAVAWLGRPCQGEDAAADAACDPALWSHQRFSEPVVAALDAALTQLRREAGAGELALVGYSGGGVLAALLAARRDDVAWLVTVSAPLALAAWRDHHDLEPLDAVDPSALPPGRLDRIPQIHLVGERDAVVPPTLAERYCRARDAASSCRVEWVDVGHAGWVAGWDERMAALQRRLP